MLTLAKVAKSLQFMLDDKKREDGDSLESLQEQHSATDIFSNEQVYVHEVPTTATLEYSGLEPAYRNVSVITTVLFFMVPALIILGIRLSGNEFFVDYAHYFWLGVALFCLVVTVVVVLEFKHKSYAIRERDLVYNEGYIWRSSTVVPFNRVQHCEVSQGPVERLFGLSELKVFTAGGSSSDISIPGLKPDTAERLKEYIVIKTGLDEEE